MSSHLFRLLAIVVVLYLSATIANAAEIRPVPPGPIVLKPSLPDTPRIAILEGTIEPGDFEKLRTFILEGPGAEQIRLASPGGDLTEAMKIGDFIRSLKLSTEVPYTIVKETKDSVSGAERWGVKDLKANFKCTGACFFVFVGGIYRHALPPVGLGFDRPHPQRSLSDRLRGRPDQIRAAVEDYLRQMDVPPKYADEMFSLSRDKVRWISSDEFNSDFLGFIPGLRDEVRARCKGRGPSGAEEAEIDRLNAKSYKDITPEEKSRRNELVAKVYAESDCEIDFRIELARGALQARKRLQ